MALRQSRLVAWRAKGIPVPPEVTEKLTKFREGIATPRMVDELAGSSLAVVGRLSTAPRYICNDRLGPLWFHHLIYSMGSPGPHQPIVLRKFLAKGLVTKQEVQAAKNMPQSADMPIESWVDLPPSTQLISLPFANGIFASWQCLRLDSRKMFAARKQSQQAKGVDRAAVEPWRVGIGLDPYFRSVVNDTPARGVVDLLHAHATEESFLATANPLQLTVRVPPEVANECREMNKLRRSRQAKEGYFAPHVAGDVGDDESSHHVVRVSPGDVCYIPAGWSYAVCPARSTSTDLLTKSESPIAEGRGDAGEVIGKWASVFRVGYKRYPRLSREQSARYVAADYAFSRLDGFYRQGGNNPHKEYQ